MEKKPETGELDLSLSKLMSGCGAGRARNRLKNNEPNQSDASVSSSLGSLLNSSVSLDPTPAFMPTRSSISSLLSLSHLRLWENPITASAISAAAAMTHLMDINNSAFSSAFGGKSSEDHRLGSRNMCLICGRVARDQTELEQHMLTHSMEKPYQCVKYGLTPNRMQGLLMTSKKRKSKNISDCYNDEPLDATMPDIKKKRMDSSLKNRSFDCRSPPGEDCKPKVNLESSAEKSMSAINSINTTAFPCTSCHKTFATEVDLKAHLMRHLTQHPFVCLACGKGFKYEHSLNFHIKSYHNSSGNVNNNNNTSSAVNNMDNETKQSDSHKLSDTEKKSENADKYQSENASEADYDGETSIDEESDEDNDDNDENHNKNVCFDYGAPANFAARSIQIKSEKILITLLEGIHPVTEQTYILYKCCLCGFAFPSLEPVILHMQTSHLNTNREFTCDKCGANFKWRSELSLHEQLHKAMDHHDKSGQLSMPSFMQPNLVLMSTDFGPNLSPSHANNNNNNDITNNNNRISDGVTLCDEKISQQNKYKPHKSITQTKPIKVKSESQHSSETKLKAEDLQSQVSLSHITAAIGDIEETAPGQFKCRFCDKTFDRIFSVHRHERVHTGFKPCICKTCGRGFSEKRNLRHHIIRFHSDGSGRELLKRNRKDKSNDSSNKRKMATSLKKAALKILNNGNETVDKNSDDNNSDKKSSESKDSGNSIKDESSKTASNSVEASIESENSTKVTPNNPSSSSTRRRKGKPSKKIIATEEFSPVSSLSVGENIENQDNDETQNTDKSREETDANSGSEINPNDFLETKFRCHGAFFSSYNPRLGVVEKPVKRNEACRPLLGPDGKFLYPCTYCNKTFCSLSDLNRHMNFHEDVRPFKCEYCNYQSRTNSQLKVHMMRHAGIKQYLCQVCNYNGVTQSDLNRHCKTRSHALRSANICPLCALGFSTRTLLDDHIIKFHEASESSNSSDKSNKASNQSKPTSERNNNDYSFSSKSFSMKEILN